MSSLYVAFEEDEDDPLLKGKKEEEISLNHYILWYILSNL